MKNLKYWEKCQEHLTPGSKQEIESMNKETAYEAIQAFYADQTDYAIDVLKEEAWLPARGIIEYLLNKYEDLQPKVIHWWTQVEKKAADNWMKETGQKLFT